jgi:hypothetical protein
MSHGADAIPQRAGLQGKIFAEKVDKRKVISILCTATFGAPHK